MWVSGRLAGGRNVDRRSEPAARRGRVLRAEDPAGAGQGVLRLPLGRGQDGQRRAAARHAGGRARGGRLRPGGRAGQAGREPAARCPAARRASRCRPRASCPTRSSPTSSAGSRWVPPTRAMATAAARPRPRRSTSRPAAGSGPISRPRRHAAARGRRRRLADRPTIDRFILAGLEARGLRPARDADRATLIRRLVFDLIGLPPTPEEIDAFVDDPSPDAYERLVDRLLASPHFGERWGRHWLDVVRFAESLTLRGLVLARRLALPRLRRSTPSTPTCRSTTSSASRSPATCCPAPSVADRRAAADRDHIPHPGQHQPRGAGQAAARHGRRRRAARHDRQGIPGADDRLRPLPRPQVRPDPDPRLLRAGRHPPQHEDPGTRQRLPMAGEAAARPPRAGGRAPPARGGRRRSRIAPQGGPHTSEGEKGSGSSGGGQGGRLADRTPEAAASDGAGSGTDDVGRGMAEIGETRVHIRGSVHNLGEPVPRGFLRVASNAPAPAMPSHESGRRELAAWLATADNPADRPRHRQPRLALALRRGARPHRRQLRHDRRDSVAPRAARRPGGPVHGGRLVDQDAGPSDRPVAGLPARHGRRPSDYARPTRRTGCSGG